MKSRKYYVVWKGRRAGIFTTWAEAEAQVKGFAGARHKAFNTRAEAEAASRNQTETKRAGTERRVGTEPGSVPTRTHSVPTHSFRSYPHLFRSNSLQQKREAGSHYPASPPVPATSQLPRHRDAHRDLADVEQAVENSISCLQSPILRLKFGE